jgi:hypothetical protein
MMAEARTAALFPMIEPALVHEAVVTGWVVREYRGLIHIIGYWDRPSASGEIERIVTLRATQSKEDYANTLRELTPLFMEAVRGRFADDPEPVHVWDGHSVASRA